MPYTACNFKHEGLAAGPGGRRATLVIRDLLAACRTIIKARAGRDQASTREGARAAAPARRYGCTAGVWGDRTLGGHIG